MAKHDWAVATQCVDKPWGHGEIFALATGNFCGKAIHVRDGHGLSLEFHEVKKKIIAVQSGRLFVEAHRTSPSSGPFRWAGARACTIARASGAASRRSATRFCSKHRLTDVLRLEDRYGREVTIRPGLLEAHRNRRTLRVIA